MGARHLRRISCALFLLSAAPLPGQGSPPVQLLLPSRTLEANSTFELRFATAMVRPEQVGQVASPSPLVLEPAVPGRFVWLSTRSGSFAPEGVLPLGAKFKISLRAGLKDRAGKAVPARLRETAETPPFRVKGATYLSYIDASNATVLPRYLVLFNANVNAAAAAKFCRFVNAAGVRVDARVEQADDPKRRDRLFPEYQSDDRSLLTWGEKPEAEQQRSEEEEEEEEEEDANPAPGPARRNVLFVAPIQPLPPGDGWRLVLEAGLPAAEAKVVLPLRKDVPIGVVKPFGPSSVLAENNRLEGRRLIIEFNKPFAEEVVAENIGKWIKLEPAPPNLKTRVENAIVTFKADFALDLPYRVSVASGLPAAEPIATQSPSSEQVTFKRIEPRLYFQDFAAHQFAGGTRLLRLVSVNVPRIHVSARLFTGEAIPVALKAYDKYYESPEELPDESHARVNAEELPGRVIWGADFTPGGAVDSQQTIALNWNEIVGANRGGVVLVTAESIAPVTAETKRVGTQSLIQLTDLGAVWKRDRHATLLHIFSLASGKGIGAARLRLLDTNGQQLAQAVTEAGGRAQLERIEAARWVFAETETDAHLIPLASGENDIPLYRLGVTEEYIDPEDDGRYANTIFLFTERGVYKPGDKLYLKGYAQDMRSGEPRIPAGKAVTLTVADAKERQIFTAEVTLSEYGSFAQEITIPPGTLGRYRIQANGAKGERLGGSVFFQVQEYKPNAFEILIPKPPETIGSTQLALPITAKYFMGKPLSKARLIWSLVARDEAFSPEGLSAFAFCNTISDFRLNSALDRISQHNAQGELPLGAEGVAQVATMLPVNQKAPQPRAAKLLCEVTDLNQQTVSESRAFTQHSSEYYFGLKRFDSVVHEGAPLPVELIAVNPEGKPLDGPVRASIRLTRISWQTNRLAAAGDTSEFESRPQLEMLWERELTTAPGVGNDRKPAVARLDQAVAGKPGEYLLEAIGKDSAGRDIVTSVVFDVAGEAETDWNYRNPYVIDLVADKDSYEPGQTATLMVKTPIAGDALVSVERDRVMRSFVVSLTGNAPAVQAPIAEGDGPNVFVSVILLRGANESPRKVKVPEYRIGYANLKVARPKEKLTVQVKPGKRTSMPGEKVELETEVTDRDGRPAADAELVLYAVDEGVLSLTGYETPDPLAFFHKPRGLSVSTALTLPTLLREDAAESDFANKGYLIGDGKGGPALLDGLRKNFIATPFWNATLRTDAQGRAHAEFKAPDSLTRYRIIAVAVTKQSQFGFAASVFEINKPIMIESGMPAFANVGDLLVLRAVVHNTTDFGGRAEVVLTLDENARAPESTRQISLAAHQSTPIDFPVEIVATGESKWRWAVRFVATDGTAEWRDEVEATIKLGHPAPLIRQVETARFEAGAGELLRISDPQILEGSGEVTVNLTNTRVGELRESLRQLLHYPYGCVEQTTSSLLPWLTIRDLRATLPELAKSDDEIKAAVNAGIRLLLTMQASAGGLSYWPGGREPILWGSAYGSLALTLAKKQGFAVPEAEYSRLLKYVSDQLRGTAKDATGYGLSDRCLAVYSLAVAEKAEPAYQDLLFQKRARLTAEDRALVALAVIESKGPGQMIDQLLASQPTDFGFSEQWFGSIERENALHLFAWTLHNPRAPRVDQLATELFARRSNGHWRTTQSNAWALLALASYLRNVETGSRESAGSVVWGWATKSFALSEATPLASHAFPIDPAIVRDPIMLTKSGGVVFSEVTVAARARLTEQPRQEQGYAIARRYAKIDDGGKLSPADNLRVGDRVLVTLEIEARRRATYVALEDPLPSVLAPINPAFKSQEVIPGERLGAEWVSDHHELREDRAVFFVDLLNPGRYTLRYLARVVSAGEAIAPTAKIEEMYHPERFGTTETLRVSAKSLE